MEHGENGKNKPKISDMIRQSANQIGRRSRKEENMDKPGPEQKKAKKKGDPKKVWFIIGTIFLILVLTIGMFAGIFLIYVNKALKGNTEVNMAEYNLDVSTELYCKNADTGEWEMYQTLYGDKNRIWVSYDEIPDTVWKAAVSIEDKRFFDHHGVDWWRTTHAVFNMFFGMQDTFGGSTITQQLIKNITTDNETTVKRKVTEIYRALQFEKKYSKEEILEMYLNTIYLGQQCYGVKTAAKEYFNKSVSDLTLAESASLIAITNNPSLYCPTLSEECRQNNRDREVNILNAMLEQGRISQAEHDAAVNEDVVFTNGTTIMGNTAEVQAATEETTSASTANYSYFTDQVIDDVIRDLQTTFGYTPEMASNLVFQGGYKIYTTQNPKYQSIAENVFENTDYVGSTDSNGEQLQAGITVMDPYTGDVVALVGGTGTKDYDRSWNWATSARQCGSAIKPIATYAPALDNGTITTASALDDYPVRVLNGSPWPYNSRAGFYGLTTVQTALIESLNTVAVRVNEMYGVHNSYEFMTQKLGFTTLSETDGQQSGNMGLGGLTEGVTTEEMAAAYSIFVNDGVYTTPRTYSKVEDANGNVILNNETKSNAAIKETTAYLMRGMLSSVITGGTGYNAYFSGMSMGGKTGTTDDDKDRYFVGYTPYYCAAVWCGYKSNEVVRASGNPSAILWRQVMSQIHEGMSDPGFHQVTSGLTTVTVCMDSGLLATDACANDIRGSRVRTVTVAADTAPTAACGLHKTINYCNDGKVEATAKCPAASVSSKSAVDYNREEIAGITAADTPYLLKTLKGDGTCPVHKVALPTTGGTTTGGTTTGGTTTGGTTTGGTTTGGTTTGGTTTGGTPNNGTPNNGTNTNNTPNTGNTGNNG